MDQPLSDQQLADRIAEATIEHGLDLDHTSADGDNPCKCGDWIDDWDAHWAELAVAVVQPELDRLRAELEQTRQQLDAVKIWTGAHLPCGVCCSHAQATVRKTLAAPAARPSAQED